MCKIAILYHSEHHGNTKKLIEGIAAETPNVDLIPLPTAAAYDLTHYDLIGFASGVYMGELHKSLFDVVNACSALIHKNVFLMFTSGSNQKKYGDPLCKLLTKKHCKVAGSYCCKGYDTYGPWKLIGGTAKGHPDEEDISEGAAFLKTITAALAD